MMLLICDAMETKLCSNVTLNKHDFVRSNVSPCERTPWCYVSVKLQKRDALPEVRSSWRVTPASSGPMKEFQPSWRWSSSRSSEWTSSYTD